MQILKLSDVTPADIAVQLRKGKTVVYPTETCYGLGCDATNQDAVHKVFEIKKRQKQKTVLVIASDVSMIMDYVTWNPTLERIAQAYWPGPVTVVTHVSAGGALPEGIVREDNTIAFRVTNHPFAQELSAELGRPIVSTSANVAAEESPYDSDAVQKMFANNAAQPDIFIDGGALPHHAPSTIIRVDNDHIDILRQGEVVVSLDET